MALDVEAAGECVTFAAVPANGDLADLRLSVARGPSDPSPEPASMVHLCGRGRGATETVEISAARGAGVGWLLEWVR